MITIKITRPYFTAWWETFRSVLREAIEIASVLGIVLAIIFSIASLSNGESVFRGLIVAIATILMTNLFFIASWLMFSLAISLGIFIGFQLQKNTSPVSNT